jgi:hypothetical protein
MYVCVFAPAAYTADDGIFICKGGDLFIRTELFFGMGRAEGPDVTEEEFRQFLARKVTRRFPDGLTVLTGRGQFRSSSGIIIREPSKLVIILYPPDQEDADRKIELIRDEYKEAFQQESVLRADSVACVSF